jgi:hypothetical protein
LIIQGKNRAWKKIPNGCEGSTIQQEGMLGTKTEYPSFGMDDSFFLQQSNQVETIDYRSV